MAFLAVTLGGCERGCLARRLADVGGVSPAASGGAALTGTDCSGGLLRCVDGRVEASRTAHLPHPCGGIGEGKSCTCPWDVVGHCACALDGLEAASTPTDAGIAQLCRPRESVARPVLPTDGLDVDVCTTDGVGCVAGVVRACETGRPARALAVCLRGCQTVVGVESPTDGEAVDLDGVVAILCRRDDAERR